VRLRRAIIITSLEDIQSNKHPNLLLVSVSLGLPSLV
jgi:hypothetical protein